MIYVDRLATKYLDKELAGRIQQLQLLGRDMRSEVRDSLWAQVSVYSKQKLQSPQCSVNSKPFLNLFNKINK